MEQEPRKATDVLLDIEAKLTTVLDLVRSQDLVIKILSNKLNDAIGRLDKLNAQPKVVVEAVTMPKPANIPPSFAQLPAGDPERTIPIVSEAALPQSSAPSGFRRNSRPETYAPKSVPQITQEQHALGDFQERKMPVQIPQQARGPVNRPDGAQPPPGRGPTSEIPGAGNNGTPTFNKNGAGAVMPPPQHLQTPPSIKDDDAIANSQGKIPVMQRCVNKNSKAIFLADVEIVDLATGQPVVKTRTNGAGRWQAPLDIGGYRVTIQKRESITKEKMEAVQDIQVDGSKPKLELPLLIVK